MKRIKSCLSGFDSGAYSRLQFLSAVIWSPYSRVSTAAAARTRTRPVKHPCQQRQRQRRRKAQIPLRRLCDKVRDKVANLSWTQIMKVRDTNHVADFRDLCPRQSPRTLSPTFPVYCNGLHSIRANKRVCRRLVTDFVANISTCRNGLCPRLSRFASATFPAGKCR